MNLGPVSQRGGGSVFVSYHRNPVDGRPYSFSGHKEHTLDQIMGNPGLYLGVRAPTAAMSAAEQQRKGAILDLLRRQLADAAIGDSVPIPITGESVVYKRIR